MSVQTQIDRLESAKQAIASAITGKGVTVPNGTMLDGMAALIESIEAGGGNSSDGASEPLYETGTIKPTQGSYSSGDTICSISGLSFTPQHVVFSLEPMGQFGHSSSSEVALTFCQGGYASNCSSATGSPTSKAYTYIQTNLVARIDIVADGFSVSAVSKCKVYAFTYRYIAFG